MELSNCSVVLNRITKEEIRRLCAPSVSNDIANGIRDKSGRKTLKRNRKNKCRKIEPKKQATAKIETSSVFKTRFRDGETAPFQSECSCCPSDEMKSESKRRKKRVKRRNFDKVLQFSDSSINIALEAGVNVHPNHLNDDNSTLQNSNLSSKLNFQHHLETSTFDVSVNHLRGKQNDKPGPSCSVNSSSKLHYSNSAREDIPISTLIKNMKAKNNLTLFNCKIQSINDEKAKPFKKRKRSIMSSQSEKPGFRDERNLTELIKKNETEIQQLDESVQRKGGTNASSFITLKGNETTFYQYTDTHKSLHTEWNSEKSLNSTAETICFPCCHSETNLSSPDYENDKGLKPKESVETKKVKEAESQVLEVLKKSKMREDFVQKARKTLFKVNEVDGDTDRLSRIGRKEGNSNSEAIINNTKEVLTKSNDPNKNPKYLRRRSQTNEEKAIVSSKQNEIDPTPKYLIAEGTNIKDAYSFLSNSSTLMSYAHENNLETQVYFQNKICSQKYLKKFTSSPQYSDKTGLIKIELNVKNNLKPSKSTLSKVQPLQTFTRKKITNMHEEKNSGFLLNTEKKLASEMHSEILAELSGNDSLKQISKTFENISSVIVTLEVVTILAIADLQESPQSFLNEMIVTAEKVLPNTKTARLKMIQYNLYMCNIAEHYLNIYGSFSKVLNYFLQNHIQLESEILLEENL